MQSILDEYPIEKDREKYLRRALAQQLLLLDRLEVTFGEMAFVDRDPAAGALLVKVAERRATLLRLNPPIGHAVSVIQHEPLEKPNSTERILAAMDRICGKVKPAAPDDPEALH